MLSFQVNVMTKAHTAIQGLHINLMLNVAVPPTQMVKNLDVKAEEE